MSQLQVSGEAKIRDIQGPVVANSGVITALDGAASQYVRGDGTLADFPTSTGGGSSVSYYLNSSVSQGTIGGVAYRELSKEPIIGAGTDITISANGYVASYITDANDPDVLSVPGGNFNCEFYFSVNNNTGNPTTYAELYKYDGTTFTLLGSSQAVPESLNQGTTIAPYYFAIPVATAALALTDRLAIRIYVSVDGRVVTLHTENSHLCQVVTTFSKGMVSLNNLTDQSQFITTGTSGTNFNIVSSGDTHTFNLPVASATNTGKLSNTDWSTFNAKQPAGNYVTLDTTQTITAAKTISGLLTVNNKIYLQTDLSTTGVYLQSYNSNEFSIGVTSGATTYYSNFILQGANRNYTFPNIDGTIALTSNIPANIVTGTGTTNTLPKFTGTSAIGNSNITDDGSLITLGSNSYVNGALGVGTSSLTGYSLRVGKSATGATIYSSITSSEQIQTDVTSVYRSFYSLPNTNAATFTLGTLAHFQATQDTFGAGSTVTNQYGYLVSSNLIGATNNYGFRGAIPSGTNRWNLFMDGTADNYLAGNIGIGVSQNYVSSGPILTTTLTNGGSGYVDGTYTDLASSNPTSSGTGALFTVIVSGGIVTTATLTWAGNSYKVGDPLTIPNSSLGGTGSGLVITVATVDSSQLTIVNANGGDITLFRNDTSTTVGENLGTIKWGNNDLSSKASGLQAEIGAFAAGSAGGAYLSFFTRSATAGTSLVEAMRIDSRGGVGIGATVLTNQSLRVSKDITGSTSCSGISNDGVVQSDVTTTAAYIQTIASTAAASFTITSLRHFRALQGTIGAGSTVTSQYGFEVDSSLIGATNNYGFYGNIASGTNRWNLYMSGTANNYMAGSLGIGSTSLTGYNLNITKQLTGAVNTYGIALSGNILSDVTTATYGVATGYNTSASAFTLGRLTHFYANQGTIGATSAITNQHGFYVEASLTGATNNYGFFGNIASGTNRWNLYMAGTAANYMAGSLGIGTTTIAANVHIKTALSTASSEEIALRIESTPTGGTADRQIELLVKNNGTAANTYGVIRLGDWFTNAGTPSKVLITASGASYFTGGAVSIGTTSVSASAALQVDSTNSGFLPPRMTAAQRTAIATPAEGLIVVQTDGTQGLYLYIGAAWHAITML